MTGLSWPEAMLGSVCSLGVLAVVVAAIIKGGRAS